MEFFQQVVIFSLKLTQPLIKVSINTYILDLRIMLNLSIYPQCLLKVTEGKFYPLLNIYYGI
ncbi:hypothetical protein XBO1_2250052 [Xenorhabdus bovienii str. oregonense]|uniref:Uncharacterized protein n=1 Tax=Xenorhabdus bovienii str. oregonense TaxID=1398202 RepID=A0A077P9B1_XENBV|nr:hypothetical protein XBO1_2250052 [Xenorhabdus bovienii str. oregonense]